MKKLLLTTAIAALSVTAAQAAPTVYGKAGVKVQYQSEVPVMDGDEYAVDENGKVKMEDGDLTLDSNSTRFGLKGGEAITANTDFIYKAEFGFDIDQPRGGSDVKFKQRDTYVGLANDQMGTVVAGRLTAIDDVINFTNPSEYKDAEVIGSFDGNRINNSMAYFSPEMSGVQLMAMYKLTDASDGETDGKGDQDGSWGVGGKYENGPLAAGITYIKVDDAGEDGKTEWDDVRVSAAYDLTSDLTVSGLYQTIDFNNKDLEDEQSYIIAGEYDIPGSKWDVYAEYDAARDYEGADGSDVDVFSVGGNYAFTKATKAQVFAGYTDKSFKNSNLDHDYYGVGAGIVHKF
ncbi:porin [Psychrobacter sp. HD31]|uniref:porin n=1 Tax=Psychrobacter sp. HD31 TaxID=3112003 RepID=UPI003DA39DF1